MKFKLCALDFDGVILDSEDFHSLARSMILEQLSVPDEAVPEIRQGTSVVGFYFSVLSSMGIIPGPVLTPEGLAERHFDIVWQYVRDKCVAVSSGLTDFLERIRGYDIKTAVVSSSMRKYVSACLKHFGLIHLFDFVVTGEDAANTKPAPDLYQYVLKLANVQPGLAFAVEDSQSGIAAANSAGITCYRYAGNIRHAADMPGLAVDSFEELWARLAV